MSLYREAKECERKCESFQTAGANVKERDGPERNMLSQSVGKRSVTDPEVGTVTQKQPM